MTITSKYCPTTLPEAAPTRPGRVDATRPRAVRQPLMALLPLALLLLLTASCQREPLPQDTGTYIAFTPDLASTKAPVEGPIESPGQISEFAVWANYDDGSGTIYDIMDNIRVYIRDGLWVYDDLKPWKTGTWNFYAFYPYDYDPSELKVDVYIPKTEGQTDEGIEIEYFDGSAMNIDLMKAEYSRTLSGGDTDDTSPVAFTFDHLLSRVDIVAKSASGGVEVTALEFSGMGVYGTYNHNDGTTTGYQNKWTLISEYNGQSLKPGSVSLTFPFPDGSTSISVPVSDTPTNLLTDLLLIPQTPGTDCKITLNYSYNGTPQPSLSLAIPADPAWTSGMRYTYTITFSADTELSVKVADWEVEEYVIEW